MLTRLSEYAKRALLKRDISNVKIDAVRAPIPGALIYFDRELCLLHLESRRQSVSLARERCLATNDTMILSMGGTQGYVSYALEVLSERVSTVRADESYCHWNAELYSGFNPLKKSPIGRCKRDLFPLFKCRVDGCGSSLEWVRARASPGR